MVFTLMNKDTPIADITFTGVVDAYTGSESYKVSHVRVRNSRLYDACVGKCSMEKFLESRKAPKHRAHIQKMFSYLNFNNTVTFLSITRGLSMIDTLWVKGQSEDVSWEKVSLFRNEFSDVIAHYAFEGTGVFGQQFRTISPEYTTDGMLPKMWKREAGCVNLYKGVSSGASNAGREAMAEFYASAIAARYRGHRYVEYDVLKHNGKLMSKCKAFTSEDLSYISMARLMSVLGIEDHTTLITHFGLGDQWRAMTVFDCLICNTDRHLGNFGVIADTGTYMPVDLSPIFDNGLGCGVYWNDDHPPIWVEADENARHPLYQELTYAQLGKRMLTDEIRPCVERLRGWTIPKHPLYNYSDSHYQALNEMLQHQVTEILK